MLKRLAPGDVVTVTRIDRLARSTFDLFAIVKQIVDAKAQFRSLAEPWADTGTSTGRLMIAVLGGLADVERDLIRTRTAEGRSRAQKRGQHMGRPPKLTDGAAGRGPPAAGARALRSPNSRAATAWERARFPGSRSYLSTRTRQSSLLRQKEGGRSRPKRLPPGLLRCADLEDRPCAWELNQRRIRRVDKTGGAAGSAAGVPHRAVIDDIGAAVRPEPTLVGRLNPAGLVVLMNA